MMDPEGPLPSSIYWRRRAAAAAGAALAMVATIWALGALIGSEEPAPGVPRNASHDEVLSADGVSSTPEMPASSVPGQEASSLLPMPFESDVSSVPALPGESVAPGESQAPGMPSAGRSAPSTPTHGKPLQRCQDRALKVDARVAKKDFKLGEQPHMQMSVTNVGKDDCFASLSRESRELIVLGEGGKRVWSSSDCYFGEPQTEIHRLRASESIAFDLNWAARTSAPGCPAARAAVPAGDYQVVAKAGKLSSKPTAFTLHK